MNVKRILSIVISVLMMLALVPAGNAQARL